MSSDETEKMFNDMLDDPDFDPAYLKDMKIPTEKLIEYLKKLNFDGENVFSEDLIRKSSIKHIPNISRFNSKGVDVIVTCSVIGILVLIFAFFGYKLYKNLVDKERKREEKAKAKQSKKKK